MCRKRQLSRMNACDQYLRFKWKKHWLWWLKKDNGFTTAIYELANVIEILWTIWLQWIGKTRPLFKLNWQSKPELVSWSQTWAFLFSIQVEIVIWIVNWIMHRQMSTGDFYDSRLIFISLRQCLQVWSHSNSTTWRPMIIIHYAKWDSINIWQQRCPHCWLHKNQVGKVNRLHKSYLQFQFLFCEKDWVFIFVLRKWCGRLCLLCVYYS